MRSAEEHLTSIKRILGMPADANELSVEIKLQDAQRAKLEVARLRTLQKELRLAKKDVQADLAYVRSAFVGQRVRVGAPSVTQGIMRGLLGARRVGSMNTLNRQAIKQQQLAVVEPYERVKRMIDHVLLQIDQLKLEIERRLTEGAGGPTRG